MLYYEGQPFLPFGFWVSGFSAERLAEIARKEGINAVAIELSWAELEKSEGQYDREYLNTFIAFLKSAQKYGLKVLLQLAGHYYPQWLEKKYPSLKMQKSDGFPGEGNFCRFCFDNPVFQQHFFRFVRFVVEHLKDEPALLGYCLWNEPALTSEVCYCSATLSAFRSYVAEKYEHSIEKLNENWKSNFLTFAGLVPPKMSQTSRVAKGKKWHDWITFRQLMIRDFFEKYARVIRSIDQLHPLTIKSLWMPLDSRYYAYSATRYDYFLDVVNVLGNDPYPHPLDFFINRWIADALTTTAKFHSLEHTPPVWWLEYNHSFWREFGQLTPEEARSLTYQSLAHGITGFFYFFYPLQRFDPNSGDNGLALVYADDLSPMPVTTEIFALGKEIQKLVPVLARFRPQPAQTALFYSLDTMTQQSGSLRPTAEFSTAADILYRLQIPFDIITEEDIRQERLKNYKLLVAAGIENCRDDILEMIQRFLNKGGWVIATAGFAREKSNGEVRQFYPPPFTGVLVDGYFTRRRMSVVGNVVPYIAEYNTRKKLKKTAEQKRASRSPITFTKDFGNLKKGDTLMAGTIKGFEDTAISNELIERISILPVGTEELAVFPDGQPAITLKGRCLYIANDLLFCDEKMLKLFDETAHRAGVVREAFAIYADGSEQYVHHIDVRCWQNETERLFFFVNAPRTYEYDGKPVEVIIGIRTPGEIFTLDGEKISTHLSGDYATFSTIFSPAETKIFIVKKE